MRVPFAAVRTYMTTKRIGGCFADAACCACRLQESRWLSSLGVWAWSVEKWLQSIVRDALRMAFPVFGNA